MGIGPGHGQARWPIVTTSWDDGHPLDRKLAELLDRTGMQGTFYIPLRNAERPVLDPGGVRDIGTRFEVGGHTWNHVRLPGLSRTRLRSEVVDAKRKLEDLLGDRVSAFCYPGGRASRAAREMVAHAGFQMGRTTAAFRVDDVKHPYALPVTMQAYPHSAMTHLRHAVREGNVVGARRIIALSRRRMSWVNLALVELERVMKNGGWWHLWGHSWEIEELGAWRDLEVALTAAATSGAEIVDNSTWGRRVGAAT